jgi:hypothetical protein
MVTFNIEFDDVDDFLEELKIQQDMAMISVNFMEITIS